MPLSIDAMGTIIAPETVMLKAKTAGNVQAVYFHAGQWVEKGARLVQLQSEIQEATVAQKQAKVTETKADYDRYLTLYRTDRENLLIQQLDTTKANYLMAVADLDAAKQALANTTLLAPFAGYVGTLTSEANAVNTGSSSFSNTTEINVGSYLEAGDPIVFISNPSHVVVEYQVAQSVSQHVALDQMVTVHSSAYPGKIFQGNIVFISPIVYQSSRAFIVRAAIENLDHALKSGMNVTVNHVLVPHRSVLVVPGIDLVPSFSGYNVYTVEDNKVQIVPVSVGERADTLVEITKGLKAGDRIIVSDTDNVEVGQTVKEAN
jgi:multidrug efflux pump subunit AcrA (membrane-fusion protein)